MLPAATDVTALHDRALAAGAKRPPQAPDPLWQAIADNHFHNCQLWAEEDLARRTHVPDSEIAANKRAIDAHNQKRNDAIERVDEQMLERLQAVLRGPGARMSSETAGAMIDRLSIASLKIHHMRIQTERTDVSRDHVEASRAKLQRLMEQRTDLASCLDRLLSEAASGEAYFKVYRQFKMYNDPALNPALYGAKR
jgi:hypothetical protein